jgi:hypothetical protein
VLLDRLLAEAGIAPASVTGPEAGSHLEVAMSAAAEPLMAALRDPAVQSSIDTLGGYDLSRAGAVEMLAGSAAHPRIDLPGA